MAAVKEAELLPDNADSPQQPAPDAPAQPDYYGLVSQVVGDAERPRLSRARDWLRTPFISPLTLLVVACGFPFAFTTLMWLLWDAAVPRPPYLSLLITLLSIAGPAIMWVSVIASAAVMVTLTVRRWWAALQRRATMDGVSVLLARADYYRRTGAADPITAAVHDYTAYVLDATPHASAWRVAGAEWILAHPGILPFGTSIYARTVPPPVQEKEGTS